MEVLLLPIRVPRASLLLLAFLVPALCAPPILAAPHAHTGQHVPAPSVVHSHLSVTAHSHDLPGAANSSNLTATGTFFDAMPLVVTAKQRHVALGTEGRTPTLRARTGGPGHGFAERQSAAARSISRRYARNVPLASACQPRPSPRGQPVGQRDPPPISV